MAKKEKPYAKKIKTDPAGKRPERSDRERLEKEISAGTLQTLLGDSVDVDDVIQISFDDLENGKKKSENVVTFRPREFVKTGDKISANIVEGFQQGKAEFRLSPKNAPAPLVTRVSFAYQSVDILSPDKGFTSLDKEVHDAVVSLYAAGNKVFSPAMVYRTMAGKSDGAFVPQEKIKEITASIQKCMTSLITIDASEEASFYNQHLNGEQLEATYSQNLLYAKSVTLKTKGWEVSAFMLMDEPVLYRYAKLKRQLFSVPLRVLDSPPSKTNDVIVLQGYLVRIVETLRRPNTKQPNEVLYQTLYELLDCRDAPKQKLLRIRGSIKSVLDYWVEIGYIRGWSETSRSRAKYSVILDVPPGRWAGATV